MTATAYPGTLQPMALHAGRGLSLVRGDGAHLFDAQGRGYIDLMSNYGVNVLGHAHPAVSEAITRQAGLLTNAHQSFDSPARDDFVSALGALLPPQLSRVCFTNSGSEAVEVAIKLARVGTGRTRLIAMRQGYHGRTFGALSLTADSRYRDPFVPLLPGVDHVAYDDIDALTDVLDASVAAVVVEPIQGEAGVRVPRPGYLQAVREACTRNGSMLIVDEVQTGLRTGAVLACSRDGVVPDVLCLGKGIGNGLPVAVTVTTEAVAATMPRGGHGSTYAGNPLVCAAGAATVRILANPQLHLRVEELGTRVIERLRSVDSPLVRDVRGRGLMIGIELRRPASPVVRELQEHGVLVLPAGRTVVRILPPLIIGTDAVDLALDRIVEVLRRPREDKYAGEKTDRSS